MADIFISYARKDREGVAALAKALGDQGWSVWWDPEIRTGTPFDRVIEKALKDARSVLVVWSHHSVESDWVRAEATYALSREILISVSIEPNLTPPVRFLNIQTEQLIDWDGKGLSHSFDKICDDISKILGSSPKHVKKAEQAAEEERKEEERRKAEEESQRLEIEKRRIAEAKQKRAEAVRKAEEERKRKEIEARRKAEEDRRRKEAALEAERARKAEGERKAEEERRRKEIEARRKALENRRRKEAELEAERARKEQVGRKAEPTKTEPREQIPAKAPIEKAKIAEAEPSEPKPGKTEPARIEKSDHPDLDAMVEVPAGEFIYQDGKAKIEKPYRIDVYPVTNSQFRKFIEAGGYTNLEYWSAEGKKWLKAVKAAAPGSWGDQGWNQPELPVVGVSFYEAEAYAKFRGKRLPSEKEWERAARGSKGRVYPWGDEFDREKCNTSESLIGQTTPVTKLSRPSLFSRFDPGLNSW